MDRDMTVSDREYNRVYIGVSETNGQSGLKRTKSFIVEASDDDARFGEGTQRQESDFLNGLFVRIEQDLLKHLNYHEMMNTPVNLDEPFVDMDVRIRETVRKYVEDGDYRCWGQTWSHYSDGEEED